MMDINLLPAQNVLSAKDALWRRRVIILLAVVSGIFFLLLAVFLGLENYFRRRYGGLIKQREEVTAQLAGKEKIAFALGKLENKAMTIESLRDSQFDFSGEILTLRDFFGAIEIRGLTLDKNGQVKMTGRAKQQADLTVFLDKFSPRHSAGLPLNKVILTGLQWNSKDGSFSFETDGASTTLSIGAAKK